MAREPVIAADKMLAKCKPKAGRTLIVGSHIYGRRRDRRALYPNAVGLDMQPGPGVDLVHDMEHPINLGEIDHIDCCSVLEHARRPWLVAQNMEMLLSESGTLLLSVPLVWRIHAYPADYWRFTPEGLAALFSAINWRELDLYSEGKLVKKIPSRNDRDLVRWFARTEVVGWGVKCNSKS